MTEGKEKCCPGHTSVLKFQVSSHSNAVLYRAKQCGNTLHIPDRATLWTMHTW
jgi:hypothetical protein